MRCISPQRQWKRVWYFYLPGTSGISRTFVFAGKWERILSNHGYTKTTICTPEELI